MELRGELRIEPGSLEQAAGAELELVIPYTLPEQTRAVMERAAVLTQGLNARISLVAVHAIPQASTYGCPTSTHAFLVARLLELSQTSPLPVSAQVVLASSRDEGFEHALRPGSTVLVGCRKQFWRTSEERLARKLAEAGHKVALVYLG
jgi:hypothetical protein